MEIVAEQSIEKSPLVTARQLAVAFVVHPRTIAKFMDEGMPVAKRGRGGRPSMFDLAVCTAWKEAREQLPADDGGPVDLTRERARKERAQALLAEQLYAVRSGKLVSTADVEKAWQAEIAAARSVILSSYTTAADKVFRAATTDGLAGVERELKAIAYGVLRELSDGAKAPKKKKRKAA